MRGSRFTKSRSSGILEDADAGASTAELCRRHGISPATFYNWKARFGGMAVNEALRLRQLEAENGKLKQLLAEATLATPCGTCSEKMGDACGACSTGWPLSVACRS